jgi:guanidinopropionase
VQPRFAGAASLMRLPQLALDDARLSQVDMGLVGVPWDGGTTNRPGARHGPRQVRDASTLVRNVNRASGINPFALCNCGDHLVSLPILRALGKNGPVSMVHLDAHTDTWDSYFGGHKYTHGTGFRRAIEEGVLDPKRTIQIGIRGALYHDAEDSWGQAQGIRVIDIDEFHQLGIEAVLAEIRRVVGDGPSYVSFDVDALDPVYAPGTGTPEIGGLTTLEAQRLLRGLQGLHLVGGDVVEVSPPFDASGNTALVAATLAFEILCVLADSVHARKKALRASQT